jgi:hypothetical protein
MTSVLSPFAAGFAAVAAYVATVLTCLHVSRRSASLRIQILSALMWCAVIAVLTVLRPEWGSPWHSLSLFAFAASCLTFAHSAVSKSISLALLHHRCGARDGTDLKDLATRLLNDQFAVRARSLVALGWVELKDGEYCITGAGEAATAHLARVQSLFRITTGPFYNLLRGTR